MARNRNLKWVYDEDDDFHNAGGIAWITDEEANEMCRVIDGDRQRALLIRSAPEMFAALEAFIAATNEQYKREDSTVVHIAPGMLVFEPYMAAVAAVRNAKGGAS